MAEHAEKIPDRKSQAAEHKTSQPFGSFVQESEFVDNRMVGVMQRKLQEVADRSARVNPIEFTRSTKGNSQLHRLATNSTSQLSTSFQRREITKDSSPQHGKTLEATRGAIVQRLEKIESQQDFKNLGRLEINFKEPKAFFGGLEGYVKFTPTIGGKEAQKIDLVQIASMQYAERPEKMKWESVKIKEDSEETKLIPVEGSDPREGKNASTSGGSVIKDAMRTGLVSEDRHAPDFHIDKIYDEPGTRPGEKNVDIVRDPAYNADRRQDENGDHILAKLGDFKPRTLPGKNWEGEIKPTTLIDAPRSGADPVFANFETTVMGDNKSWASVEWGFKTKYNLRNAGNEVESTYVRLGEGSTAAFKKALRNYEDIVRSGGDTSDGKLKWLKENTDNEFYLEELDSSTRAFSWALRQLSQSLQQTKNKKDVSDQKETATLYLMEMVKATERFLLLPKLSGGLKKDLEVELKEAKTELL